MDLRKKTKTKSSSQKHEGWCFPNELLEDKDFIEGRTIIAEHMRGMDSRERWANIKKDTKGIAMRRMKTKREAENGLKDYLNEICIFQKFIWETPTLML